MAEYINSLTSFPGRSLILAGLTGLEPAAFALTGQRSNQAELQPQ